LLNGPPYFRFRLFRIHELYQLLRYVLCFSHCFLQ
jgi:hypothetical protein